MHIAIIGNGISGVTAARHLRKMSDHTITLISGESDYFFSRTALMYIYMGHMRLKDTQPYEPHFWKKNRIDLLKDFVKTIDSDSKKLVMESGKKLSYDKLIIACGSKSNKFGWPGQDLKAVHGLYDYQDLEAMERHSPGLKQAVIVGGGLIGIEMAEMFHSRHIPVTMLIRESNYWDNVLPIEEAQMINRHALEHGLDLRLETELKEILSDDQGQARAVVTNKGETIECGFVGLTAGVSPNIGFVKNQGHIETQKGILVDEHLETNVKDIFAIGDCAQLRNPKPGRRPIEAIWYTGRMMGETVAHNICGNPVSYDPGLWFNSAKFLDIEYQVYGDVRNHTPEGQSTFYWEHPDGKKAIRLNYDTANENILGFNLMGLRFRHEVCEKWILQKTHIDEVLRNLALANFDPEFYKQYERDIIHAFNQKTGKTIKLKSKRNLNSVIRFLRS